MLEQNSGSQKITPYLWFDGVAEEAANFYVRAFSSSGTPSAVGHVARFSDGFEEAPGAEEGEAMTVQFRLGEHEFVGLNGGPDFKFTPAVSFFVACDSAEEVDALYEQLAEGGQVLMPLDAYPFSERYAWINDKYGVSWQLIERAVDDKICPSFLFVGEQYGRAEEAMNFWISIFEDAAVGHVSRYGPDAPDREDAVAYASFTLAGQQFVAMDSGLDHAFTFTEATSLFVQCADQQEVDHFWYKLIADGGEESMCGWLKDRFGVSWQIIPERLMALLSDSDPQRTRRAVEAMLQMQKIDVAALDRAADGA